MQSLTVLESTALMAADLRQTVHIQPQCGNGMLLYTDQRFICLQFVFTSLSMVENFRVSVTQHF